MSSFFKSAGFLVLGLILGAVLTRALFLSVTPTHAICTVSNGTGGMLNEAAVTVHGREFRARELPPGGAYTFSVEVHQDAHYSVRAVLADGRSVAGEVGYLTSGMNSRDRITITVGGVDFASEPSPAG